MLVSVCLPVFNGAKFLPEAIKSVLAQSHREFELLIADDGSSDGSWEIINSLAASDQRIKVWRNHERLGLFGNYNRTIGSATGEYIKPFAQDDILNPNALESMVRALRENETASLVASGRNVLSESSGDLYGFGVGENGSNKKEEAADKFQSPVEITGESNEGHYAPLSRGLNPGKLVVLKCLAQYRNLVGEPVTVMYRARHKEEQFSRDYRSLGDLELWLRLLSFGDLYYIPEPLVHFRQHEGSRTSELLADIDWVLDFPRLSREYLADLSRLGIDRTSYCVRFLELAAPLVEKYASTDSDYINGLPPYKELAYYMLMRLPSALNGEANYKSVLKSTSWRVTKPLRMFRKRLEK
ncbi:MAG TPA: glycosyltransferase [Oculatellaceae cyanobacterium]